MPDGLHPNEDGYRVWGKALEPALTKLLVEDPSEGR
jgi:lysophospholipase L1-like esterase